LDTVSNVRRTAADPEATESRKHYKSIHREEGMKGIRTIKGLLIIAAMALTLAACGGGGGTAGDGGGTGTTTGTATIQGQVSGTVFIAVDSDTDLEAARAAASGTPKTFSMVLPTGHDYRFYLVENEGRGTPENLPRLHGVDEHFPDDKRCEQPDHRFRNGHSDFDKGTAVPAKRPDGVFRHDGGGREPVDSAVPFRRGLLDGQLAGSLGFPFAGHLGNHRLDARRSLRG
jgi:hypothetical protein